MSGYATHYSLGPDGRTTNGNCSLPAIPKDRLYVAVGPDLYAGGAGCGSYFDVTGPHGTVRVEVADSCHECVHGHLDLSEEAFRAIGDYDAGIITTSYVPVAASTVPRSPSGSRTAPRRTGRPCRCSTPACGSDRSSCGWARGGCRSP
ncbi:Expansin-YoaJ precursor [Clavibacter michiganensis subsp. michiganensis]|uniref:Expansin-YoaJ n=1 Tax=Clavibacter michiganensis subsp. michiganensis TaxID=33013 RepID=A0A251XE59_CLAMM|nr:Expansin-YoaJ precursor [Clavibacter michiganensis subsp. michiganensis]OUE00662.1 Expansin-YoaJ precursor [Clavibacter michiganensis subsp. michiganensis]